MPAGYVHVINIVIIIIVIVIIINIVIVIVIVLWVPRALVGSISHPCPPYTTPQYTLLA